LGVVDSFEPTGKLIQTAREKSWLNSSQLILPKESDIKSAKESDMKSDHHRTVPLSIEQLREREALRRAEARRKAAAARKKAKEAEASRIAAEDARRKVPEAEPVVLIKDVEISLEEPKVEPIKEEPIVVIKQEEADEVKVEKKKERIPKAKAEMRSRWAPKAKHASEKKKKARHALSPSGKASSVESKLVVEAAKEPVADENSASHDKGSKMEEGFLPESTLVVSPNTSILHNTSPEAPLNQVYASQSEVKLLAYSTTILSTTAVPEAPSDLVKVEDTDIKTIGDLNISLVPLMPKVSFAKEQIKYCPPSVKIISTKTVSCSPLPIEEIPDVPTVLPVDAAPIIIRSDYRVSANFFSSVIRRPRLSQSNIH